MRIVATSDTHFPFTVQEEGDVFVHAGDLMYSGQLPEWQERLTSLRNIQGFRHKLLVPGNHDYYLEHYAGLARTELRRARVMLLNEYNPTAEIDGVKFLAIPFVTGLPGWAYNRDEDWVSRWLEQVTDGFTPDVVISHAPLFGTLDATNPNASNVRQRNHVGGLAANRWYHAAAVKPKLWICGHIHESYGILNTDTTRFHNVAMCDRAYEQSNAPHVIDLD